MVASSELSTKSYNPLKNSGLYSTDHKTRSLCVTVSIITSYCRNDGMHCYSFQWQPILPPKLKFCILKLYSLFCTLLMAKVLKSVACLHWQKTANNFWQKYFTLNHVNHCWSHLAYYDIHDPKQNGNKDCLMSAYIRRYTAENPNQLKLNRVLKLTQRQDIEYYPSLC